MSEDILQTNTVSAYAKKASDGGQNVYYNVLKTARKKAKSGNDYNAAYVNMTELQKAIADGACAVWKGNDGSEMVSLFASAKPIQRNVAQEVLTAIQPSNADTQSDQFDSEIPF